MGSVWGSSPLSRYHAYGEDAPRGVLACRLTLNRPARMPPHARPTIRSGTRTRSCTRCTSRVLRQRWRDGTADFKGLTEKLDYLQDLGITALWLLPFYPSPLRDDGYDIADYTSVNRDYGKIDDFRELLEEAHRRGLKVITELVINHTSDQHPWFQRARTGAAGKPELATSTSGVTRPSKYADARIIFKDFETSNWSWDPVAKAYYWHRFYSHQPDLNFDNPAVRQALYAGRRLLAGHGRRRHAAGRGSVSVRA